tara:strand:+ start:586 stop:996 length:411 start_codon:yes stop_codon:yes gene_type:complete
MATFTSDQINGNQVFKPFPDGNLGVRYAKYSVTAAPNTSDVYQMVDVFAGETVHDVKIKSSDLDTGTDLVYGVGDGGDTDKYIAASTAGQGGTADEMDADVAPVTYTSDDTIDIIVEVDPAGDVATGTLEMWVYVS